MADRRGGWLACAAAPVLLAAALASGSAAYSDSAKRAAPAITVADAWIRSPAAPGRPAAGYMRIANAGAADRLVAVTSPPAARVEIHRTTQSGGVSRMRRLDGLAIPAGARVAFAPGGPHLMIFGLSATPGARVALRLRFASGRMVEARARVEAAGAAMEHAH